MTKVIIPLLQAPATIKDFLFLNNNSQNYAISEDDEITEAATGIDAYLLPTIAVTISIARLAYLINQ